MRSDPDVRRRSIYLTSIWIGALFAAPALFTACSASNSGKSSQIQIRIPKSAAVKAATHDAGSGGTRGGRVSDVEWDNGCYAVNVTGSDIPNASTSSCQVPTGVLTGTVAAGGTLTLAVPRGVGRKLEVFLYKRVSAAVPCPVLTTTFGALDPNSVVRVGVVTALDTTPPVVNVDVYLTLPNSGDSLLTQYSLATRCSLIANLPNAGTGIQLGHSTLTGGNYTLRATLSDSPSGLTLSGGNYIMKLNH